MQYGLRRGNREACSSAHHWGRLFQAADRTVRLIALTKGALADFAISHGEPDPEEQVFPNAWDPAVISYLVLIVVLPINCCLELKSGRRDIDSARKYSGIANGRENERRKDGKWACTTLGVSWSKRGPTQDLPAGLSSRDRPSTLCQTGCGLHGNLTVLWLAV